MSKEFNLEAAKQEASRKAAACRSRVLNATTRSLKQNDLLLSQAETIAKDACQKKRCPFDIKDGARSVITLTDGQEGCEEALCEAVGRVADRLEGERRRRLGL